MFDWDRFKNGEIAVHCDTEGKANDFLNMCKNRNINWCTGRDVTKRNYWEDYKKDTCYCCFDGDSKLGYADCEFYISEGREIIKWEVKEMKELTFKEVIANIKEGEEWVCDNRSIRCINGGISITNNNGIKSDCFLFIKERKFTLKRKEYTFEDAFKAYEEGKVIESCFSSQKFRIYSWEDIFNAKEIKEKWYIND